MRISKRGVRAGWLSAVAVGAIAISSPGLAQQSPARLEYNLPAQDLGDALRAVAQASQREIIFVSDAVRGRRAPQLHGSYTVEEAVRALLAGTDLVAEFREDTVLVRGRTTASEVSRTASSDEEVVVTGTRIRGAPPTSPVISITRNDMADAGQSDLGDVIRSIPQNFGGGQNPGIAGGGTQGGPANQNLNNSSAPNLRGLGPDATLTLISGHRAAYDATNQGIDIAAIPVAAVERVEIVADGASALYGSDAVGGVINVILRRSFEGAVTSARFGASTDGGNEQQQYGLVAGHRWQSGGFMFALDYNHSTPITARNRSYASSLDDTTTLLAGQRQYAAVLSGRQQLSGSISLEIDGQFSDRDAQRASPFSATASVFQNGSFAWTNARSYSLTPTIRVELPSQWEANVTGTFGESRTRLRTQRYANGLETIRSLVLYENHMRTIEVGAEGPLLSAPGGPVRLAVGGGYRSPGLDVTVTNTSAGVTTTPTNYSDSRDIAFAYGELSVPLVSPINHSRFANRLSFNAALRYERYRGIEGVATPKLGLVYEPIPEISLRATWGHSFKAPTLNQENQNRAGSLLPGAIFVPSNLPAGATVIILSGGNPELRPERATTWSATMTVRPRALQGLTLEASYFDVRYRDRITTLAAGALSFLGNPIYQPLVTLSPTPQQVADAVAGLTQGLVNQTGQPFNPTNVGAIIDVSFQNLARQSVRGVDLSAEYRADLGPEERLRLLAAATYIKGDQQIIAGEATVQTAGVIFNPPHWRARAGATWQRSNLTLSTFVNYIGRDLDNRFQPFVGIDAQTTVDLVARIRSTADRSFLHGWEASFSILNLFGSDPSPIRTTNPTDVAYDSTVSSPVGRFIGVAISKSW